MNTKETKFEKYLRLVLVLIAVVLLIEALWFKRWSVEHTIEKWTVTLALSMSFASAMLGIFYHSKFMQKTLLAIGFLTPIVISVYMMATAAMMWLTTVGWEGCVFTNESLNDCYVRLNFVWKYFPLTSPYIDLNYLWGRGFGGGYELTYVVATVLFTLGIIGIIWVNGYREMTWISLLMTTGVLLSSTVGAFYVLFTLTNNRESWPGIIFSVFVLSGFLMMDWLFFRSGSDEKSEE